MANPVLIGAKLTKKRSALSMLEGEVNGLLSKRSELEASVDDAATDEDLNTLESEVDEIEAELSKKEEAKSTLEAEIEELEGELEKSNRKKPTVTKTRSGKGSVEELETRDAIDSFVRTKGQTRDGYKSVDGGALIPENLMPPRKALEDTVDLSTYVNKVPVTRPSGNYPIIKKSGSKMVSVAELEKNPELAKPTITKVDYAVETYRGYIPVSQEVIEDADYDITGMIAEEIKDQDLNTKNAKIAAIFKTATAKAVEGLDGIISMLNKDFKQVYNVKLYVSSSLFNELDLLKDKNGRYLLQDDITVASGKRVKGREVVVLDDDMIGNAVGDLVGFAGDAKEFCTLFDRKQASVKWTNNDIYGELLAGYVRFDTRKVDDQAGYYITFTPDEIPAV